MIQDNNTIDIEKVMYGYNWLISIEVLNTQKNKIWHSHLVQCIHACPYRALKRALLMLPRHIKLINVNAVANGGLAYAYHIDEAETYPSLTAEERKQLPNPVFDIAQFNTPKHEAGK